MAAFGEDRADIAAGPDVSGLSAAALLGGRGLRSVPSAGSRSDAPILSDAPIKDASDGGAAAGPATIGSTTPGPVPVGLAPAEPAAPALTTSDLEAALALLVTAITAAPDELAGANFLQAADFTELTEELSRRVEYLQLVAADAVDRTRTEAIKAAEASSRAAGWTTGWGNEPEPVPATDARPSNAAAATAGPSTAATSDARRRRRRQ
jgi:hypothetical protein